MTAKNLSAILTFRHAICLYHTETNKKQTTMEYKKGLVSEILNRIFTDGYEYNHDYDEDVKNFMEEATKDNPLKKK